MSNLSNSKEILSQWLSNINNYMMLHATFNDMCIDGEVCRQLLNQKFKYEMFSTNGTFNRSIKNILEQSNYITHISVLPIRTGNIRKTFLIFSKSDIKYSDIKLSDMSCYSDKISDINNKRISFLNAITENLTPTPSLTPTDMPTNINILDNTNQQSPIQQTNQPSPTQQTNLLSTEQLSTTKEQYPLLSSLGIEANFDTSENADRLGTLLAEIISLHKNDKKDLKFTHVGNSKPGVLVQVPKASSYNSYNRNERRSKWLDKALDFISKNSTNNSSVQDVTSWLLRDVHKKFPSTFLKVATDLGLHVVQTMTKIEAAAMWTEANVPIRVARIILSHLQKKFKNRVQVPFSQIDMLSDITTKLEPKFGSFLYKKIEKNNEKKVMEKIEFWCYPILDLPKLDFERLLLSEPLPDTGFGYSSKEFGEKKGVIIIIGSDHGCAKSRFLIRTNYLSSSARRSVNKVEYGARTIQFAEVNCKKDVHDVHAKISPGINEAIQVLESSTMYSVWFKKNVVKCIFLPLTATNLRTVKNDISYYIKYDINERNEQMKVDIDGEYQLSQIEIKKVLPSMKIVIAGDLAYFATCTGRDGHSHCRCPYCDLTKSSWSNSYVTPTPISLKMLHNLATIHQSSTSKTDDTKGVIMAPLLEVEPFYYIVPILHLLIGIVNKEWTSMVHFFDEFVENVSDLEATLKDKKLEHDIFLHNIKEDIDVLTVNKDMACLSKDNCSEANDVFKQATKELKRLQEIKKQKSGELKSVSMKLKIEQQKRKHYDNGMENLLYNILEESHIQKQHFHGGAMNGVCCRRLLGNVEVIFSKIRKLASERLSTNNNRDFEKDIVTLTSVIDKFEAIFDATDVVFSNLRVLDPTPEEMETIEKGIRVLEQMWNDLELVITPKVHILFRHTMIQVYHFGGIADIVEDFIEKFHQYGKKLDHLVARMSSQGFRKQEFAKIRRQWLSNDPAVLSQLEKVQQSRKRKCNHSPIIKDNKSTRSRDSKRVKRERVRKSFDAFC